jgi:hypothetical protein
MMPSNLDASRRADEVTVDRLLSKANGVFDLIALNARFKWPPRYREHFTGIRRGMTNQ